MYWSCAVEEWRLKPTHTYPLDGETLGSLSTRLSPFGRSLALALLYTYAHHCIDEGQYHEAQRKWRAAQILSRQLGSVLSTIGSMHASPTPR